VQNVGNKVTKEQLFSKIVKPSIETGLVAAYQINPSCFSEKQETLIDTIAKDLYSRFKDNFTLKYLEGKYEEVYGTTDTLQKD
jgi:hypothetical protein